nr:LptF/LptG family permease [Bacteroidota bacterium]
MLRTLDRYIIRQFLGTFFFILIIIMAIAVVFDFSEKTEDFAKMSAGWQEVVIEYYVNFVIYYSNLFSGLLIFLAVLLFTSKLAHRTEIVAMLSSGVSFPRIMWPYFVAATLLTLISLLTNHFLLPTANSIRLAFEEDHIRTTFRVDDK